MMPLHILHQEKTYGPYDAEKSAFYVSSGVFPPDALGSTDGGATWEPLHVLLNLPATEAAPATEPAEAVSGCSGCALAIIGFIVLFLILGMLIGPEPTRYTNPKDELEKRLMLDRARTERREAEKEVRMERYREEARRR